MARPLWFVNLVKRSFPSRFLMAKLTHILPINKIVDYGLFADDDIIYLPKNNIIPINQPIAQQTDMVLPSTVVEHFTEEANYHWIMNFCINAVVAAAV